MFGKAIKVLNEAMANEWQKDNKRGICCSYEYFLEENIIAIELQQAIEVLKKAGEK